MISRCRGRIAAQPSKTGFFSPNMRRVGKVIGVGKDFVVQQRPCVVVPAYHTSIHVLDHDVVWTKSSANMLPHP